MNNNLAKIFIVCFTICLLIFINLGFNGIAYGSGWPEVGKVVISPNYGSDSTLFAALTVGGEVYLAKSTNAGSSWSVIKKIRYGIAEIVISPDFANDKTIFVTKGDVILKSSDAGNSWERLSKGFDKDGTINVLALSPNYASDKTLFATDYSSSTSRSNIYKSTNRGFNWAKLSGPNLYLVSDIEVSPNYANDMIVFVADRSLYKSADTGGNWTKMMSLSGLLNVQTTPNFASSNTLFLHNYLSTGLLKSIDGGNNWTFLGSIDTNLILDGIYSLALSPNFVSDNIMLAGLLSSGVYKSTNGGASWSSTKGIGMNMVSSIVFSSRFTTDNTAFAGTTDGFYKTTNSGSSWTSSNDGLKKESDLFLFSDGDELEEGSEIKQGKSVKLTAELNDSISAPLVNKIIFIKKLRVRKVKVAGRGSASRTRVKRMWIVVAKGRTDGDGIFRFTGRPLKTAEYRAVFAGDKGYYSSYSNIEVVVKKK